MSQRTDTSKNTKAKLMLYAAVTWGTIFSCDKLLEWKHWPSRHGDKFTKHSVWLPMWCIWNGLSMYCCMQHVLYDPLSAPLGNITTTATVSYYIQFKLTLEVKNLKQEWQLADLNKIQIYKRLKTVLFIKTKTRSANFQGNPLYQATKKKKCKAKTRICFWLRYVVFLSSAWKNLQTVFLS